LLEKEGNMSINKLNDLSFFRTGITAWITLIVGLLITALVWNSLREQHQQSSTKQFDLMVREVVVAIEKRLYGHEQILLGVVGLFDSSEFVSRDEWNIYMQHFKLSDPKVGIQSIGYAPFIASNDANTYLSQLHQEGFSNHSIFPEGKRDFYIPITYISPIHEDNLHLLGYDMYAEMACKEGMQKAVESGTTTITDKLQFNTQLTAKPDFVMYMPIYRHGLPINNAKQRWNALQGFVYSAYHINDLMHGILANRNNNIDFTVNVGVNDNQTADVDNTSLIYNSTSANRQKNENPPTHQAIRYIQAYNNIWTIKLNSRANFDANTNTSYNWIVPCVGFAISLLLFTIVRRFFLFAYS
jgi:CHASE1-domain containing sensor protein